MIPKHDEVSISQSIDEMAVQVTILEAQRADDLRCT
jgi:hypothetical protein